MASKNNPENRGENKSSDKYCLVITGSGKKVMCKVVGDKYYDKSGREVK